MCNLIIIKTNKLHRSFSNDSSFKGPQKFHTIPVPRIGGISIYISIFLITIYDNTLSNEANDNYILKFLVISAAPAFLIGLIEDITKKISPRLRLVCITISSLTGGWFLSFWITSTQIYCIDLLLTVPLFSIIFTSFAITGVTNAYNLIDGFNGLSSMIGAITLISISIVAYSVNDINLYTTTIVIVFSIAGFLIWNFPRGLIFLGDGGAYLIGYLTASLSILLVNRNPSVSPWFALLVNIYPIFETTFTIWRRKIIQGGKPFSPDAMHLHSLIYRRITNKNNSRTSTFLWCLSLASVIPAVIFFENSLVLQLFTLIFCTTYLWIYRIIVKFKLYI
jgi:UDP-N-acetylmuramyl pentapeptide phosphotransferase/UDP-N-acetylglucosamine-1-phosphate transferase